MMWWALLILARIRAKNFARSGSATPMGKAEAPAPTITSHLRPPAVRQWRQGQLSVAGMFSAALGLKGFRLPKGLIGGEITGLSWVSSSVSGAFWSLLVIQVPFLVLGYSSLGQKFALRTLETLWALAGGISSFPYPLA
ncbi:YitT family protein [Hymenobacter volaticus]|uniref:YitT family protein n=1 Tax=Hymenobacter volaticus TaxID=2932254 RepID=UPI001FD6EB4F|nr:YitT family protein [Hymenobacter volaticus]